MFPTASIIQRKVDKNFLGFSKFSSNSLSLSQGTSGFFSIEGRNEIFQISFRRVRAGMIASQIDYWKEMASLRKVGGRVPVYGCPRNGKRKLNSCRRPGLPLLFSNGVCVAVQFSCYVMSPSGSHPPSQVGCDPSKHGYIDDLIIISRRAYNKYIDESVKINITRENNSNLFVRIFDCSSTKRVFLRRNFRLYLYCFCKKEVKFLGQVANVTVI